jgi:magnesium transporter
VTNKKLRQKNNSFNGEQLDIGPKALNSSFPVSIRCINYNLDQVTDEICTSLEKCATLSLNFTHWIHVDGVHDSSIIHGIGKEFSLHPLLVEDIMTTRQRPKVDDFSDYLYIVFRLVRIDPESLKLEDEQISLVVGNNYLLSFVQRPTDLFDSLIERLKKGKGLLRQQNSGFLAYAIIDTVVDSYFDLLDKSGSEIESLEDYQSKQMAHQIILPQIHNLRREIIIMRKAIWPIREVVAKLERDDMSHLISSTTKLYLRDVYDHSIVIVDTIDAFRDLSRGILDVYLAQMSYKMNEVIKILTVVGTIFIPLTFITSYYGMNFKNMPELSWKYGYPLTVVIMLIVTFYMLRYFKKKRWF